MKWPVSTTTTTPPHLKETHIIWKYTEILNIFFNISSLPTYQVFSTSVNDTNYICSGQTRWHLPWLFVLSYALSNPSRYPIGYTFRLYPVWPVLKTSTATTQVQATVIYPVNYCSSLPALAFAPLQLIFHTSQEVLLKKCQIKSLPYKPF